MLFFFDRSLTFKFSLNCAQQLNVYKNCLFSLENRRNWLMGDESGFQSRFSARAFSGLVPISSVILCCPNRFSWCPPPPGLFPFSRGGGVVCKVKSLMWRNWEGVVTYVMFISYVVDPDPQWSVTFGQIRDCWHVYSGSRSWSEIAKVQKIVLQEKTFHFMNSNRPLL
jgi:hypothetical protein